MRAEPHLGTLPDFDAADLLDWLEVADDHALDALPYGVIRMDADGVVLHYNTMESRASGLGPGRVLGRPFFAAVAPCMANALVAGRFDTEPRLDARLSFVLTMVMRPTPVEIRLLQSPEAAHAYVVVRRR